MRMRVLYADSAEWLTAARQIEQKCIGPASRIIKMTARASAGFLRLGEKEAFFKRIETGSWSRGLLSRLGGSHAARALRGAEILERAGFAHSRPLAAIEARWLGAIRVSYVITEPLRSARIFSQFALADGRNFQRREWICRRVASEIKNLHDAGIYTLDMQETNLMLESHGDQLTVYFIDLEDFRQARRVSTRRRLLNLVQLDRSVGRFIPRTRRLRFLYCYLGYKPSKEHARQLVRRLLELRRRAGRRSASAKRAVQSSRPAPDANQRTFAVSASPPQPVRKTGNN